MKQPHLDYIKTHKINIEKSKAPTSLKRALSTYDKSVVEFNGIKDEQLKNQWTSDLQERSEKLLEDLEEHFPQGKEIDSDDKKAAEDKAAADKKAAEDKAAADKKAEEDKAAADKKAADKKAAEDKAAADKAAKDKKSSTGKTAEEKAAEDKAAADKKAAEDKAASDKKAAEEKEEKPDQADIDAKKALDDLWLAKSKDGKMILTEDELKESGFSCWKYLNFFSGEFEGYVFASKFGSEDWAITKGKPKVEEKED